MLLDIAIINFPDGQELYIGAGRNINFIRINQAETNDKLVSRNVKASGYGYNTCDPMDDPKDLQPLKLQIAYPLKLEQAAFHSAQETRTKCAQAYRQNKILSIRVNANVAKIKRGDSGGNYYHIIIKGLKVYLLKCTTELRFYLITNIISGPVTIQYVDGSERLVGIIQSFTWDKSEQYETFTGIYGFKDWINLNIPHLQ